MKTYTAVAQRSGDWWAISVPAVSGVFTQAKRLDQVERTAREAIALVLDAPESQVHVAVSVDLPNDLADLRNDVMGLRVEIDDKKERYKREFSKAVASLTKDMGLSMRDVASILGVSFQRVSQVEGAAAEVLPLRARKAAQVPPRKVAQAAARKVAPAPPFKGAKAAAGRAAPAKAATRRSSAAQVPVSRKSAVASRQEAAAAASSRRDTAARRRESAAARRVSTWSPKVSTKER